MQSEAATNSTGSGARSSLARRGRSGSLPVHESAHSLYHRVNRRQMPFVRKGRVIRFDRFALDRWMAKGVRHGFDEAR